MNDTPLIDAGDAIGVVGIVTRGRPASLAACVQSYLENCRRHGRALRFIVTDDSPDVEVQAQTRSALQPLRDRDDTPISYAGRLERIRFVEELAQESDVPVDIVRFGLLGDDRCLLSTGANRNSLLLDTVGELALSVDDDTRCRTAAPPGAEDTLAFFDGYDPTAFWFFDDHRSALASASFVDVDLLGCHEALLGHGVADGSGARIAITLHGLLGDSGMGSPRYYLGLEGASRARLVASLEAYRSAFRSREVLRAVQRPTCAASPFCMTTGFGFDNRFLLPPFFPVQRNSDGIFGLVLQKCVDGSRVGFVPSVVVHRPDSPRVFAPDEMWTDIGSIRMADLVMACVLAHDAGAAMLPATTRVIQLGRYLRELGALTLSDFEACVRGFQQRRAMAFITVLESRLLLHNASPRFWADDARRMSDLLRKATNGDEYVVPRDLREGRSVEEARRLSQQLIARFGELLEAWPTILTAARHLRAKGRRVTTPL